MILQIHDELIFDVLEDELGTAEAIVEEGMQHAMQLQGAAHCQGELRQDVV